jgi:AcrR family transcriptional regulator
MFPEFTKISAHILEMEQKGLVTRTFRRLDPQRQQAIVLAILDEAMEKGPTELNIKDVAGRAGVSVGSLYTYFNHRQGLLDFTIELCVWMMTDAFDEFRPYLIALPLREALEQYVYGGIEWSKTQTGLMQFFARAAYQGHPGLGEQVVRPVAGKMREITQGMLEQAAARGEIRADLDLEAMAGVVNALLIAVSDSQLLPYLNTYFQVGSAAVSFERALAAMIALIWEGLRSHDRAAN